MLASREMKRILCAPGWQQLGQTVKTQLLREWLSAKKNKKKTDFVAFFNTV